MLSGRGLCDELITRPEESYRLCCIVVCDLETSRMGAPYIYIYDISSLRVKRNGKKGMEETQKNFIPSIQMSSTHSYAVFIQSKTGVLSLNATSGMQSMDKVTLKSFKSYCK